MVERAGPAPVIEVRVIFQPDMNPWFRIGSRLSFGKQGTCLYHASLLVDRTWAPASSLNSKCEVKLMEPVRHTPRGTTTVALLTDPHVSVESLFVCLFRAGEVRSGVGCWWGKGDGSLSEFYIPPELRGIYFYKKLYILVCTKDVDSEKNRLPYPVGYFAWHSLIAALMAFVFVPASTLDPEE